jgi:hypothetical protein
MASALASDAVVEAVVAWAAVRPLVVNVISSCLPWPMSPAASRRREAGVDHA